MFLFEKKKNGIPLLWKGYTVNSLSCNFHSLITYLGSPVKLCGLLENSYLCLQKTLMTSYDTLLVLARLILPADLLGC